MANMKNPEENRMKLINYISLIGDMIIFMSIDIFGYLSVLENTPQIILFRQTVDPFLV